MPARTPLTEIEVGDIGTVRLPNMWQQVSLKRVRGPNREIARFAAAGCVSIKQFKSLPAEKQHEIRLAISGARALPRQIEIYPAATVLNGIPVYGRLKRACSACRLHASVVTAALVALLQAQ